jgi:hypothetical protein
MKNFTLLSFLLFVVLAGPAQSIKPRLVFQPGQSLQINREVKTTIAQQAMGQAIDMNVEGVAVHVYKVTNHTDDNSTLHHEPKSIKFNFEGMGQKRPFDSNNEKDMQGPLGKPIQETLAKTYDMIIDPSGKVLLVQPQKLAASDMDERLKIITAMLSDILDVAEPPLKGENSFFKVFPDTSIAKGDSWTETFENKDGKFTNRYTLSEITDSTLEVDLAGSSSTVSKLEIMGGMELTTSMNNKTTGKIIVDKATGLVRSKSLQTESSGTTQGMGNETPITSKTSILSTVTAMQ